MKMKRLRMLNSLPKTIKESNNTSSTLQIPEAAKGPPIPAA
jgi:hypothetical protein